jgi:hypothetical protein
MDQHPNRLKIPMTPYMKKKRALKLVQTKQDELEILRAKQKLTAGKILSLNKTLIDTITKDIEKNNLDQNRPLSFKNDYNEYKTTFNNMYDSINLNTYIDTDIIENHQLIKTQLEKISELITFLKDKSRTYKESADNVAKTMVIQGEYYNGWMGGPAAQSASTSTYTDKEEKTRKEFLLYSEFWQEIIKSLETKSKDIDQTYKNIMDFPNLIEEKKIELEDAVKKNDELSTGGKRKSNRRRKMKLNNKSSKKRYSKRRKL